MRKPLLCCLWLTACATVETPTQMPRFPEPRGGVFQEPIALVSTTNDDLLGDIAPAGNRVVYAAKVGGNLDVFVRDLASGAVVRLTTHSTDDTDPVLSPDGKWVAWVAQAEDVKGDIWIIRVNGKEPQQLTDRTSTDRAPVWSADGQRVFFATRPRGEDLERVDVVEVKSGRRSTVVPVGWDPAPAPDGEHLFYVALDDRRQPRLYVKNLANGKTAALTDGAYPEGLPRATRVGGEQLVFFTRFVDDQNGDGVADARDPSSLWAVQFSPSLLEGEPPHRARPLTAAAGSEIFPSPVEDWLVFTATGYGDLDVFALPIGGMINPRAGPEMILDAARAEDRPALRRFALRYLVATSKELEAQARYELARDLARRRLYNDAIEELRRVVAAADGEPVGEVASLEIHRLHILRGLGGQLIVREDAQRRLVNERLAALSQERATHTSAESGFRERSIRAEAQYALGQRHAAVAELESIAAAPDVPPEDGARALLRLAEMYSAMEVLDAVERVCVTLLQAFPSEREEGRDAATLWVDLTRRTPTRDTLSALEQIRVQHPELTVVGALATRALALEQEARGHREVSQSQWEWLIETYPNQRELVAEALLRLANQAESARRYADALRLFDRLMAQYPDDVEIRSRARGGITRIALQEAVNEDRRARAATDPQAQRQGWAKALAAYERLIREDGSQVLLHRRRVQLAAQLGLLERMRKIYAAQLKETPADLMPRYILTYIGLYAPKVNLGNARSELEELVSLDPRFAAAHLSLSWVYQQLDRRSPGDGWVEKSLDTLETVIDLLQPLSGEETLSPNDRHLLAAAHLNAANALESLGKRDAAFQHYLERELLREPFVDPVTEAQFYFNFARVALGEGIYDVALDMALTAARLPHSRPGENAALVAAIYMQLGEHKGAGSRQALRHARHWLKQAEEVYRARSDYVRLIPILRDQALVNSALGEHAATLGALNEIQERLQQGEGPGELKAPGPAGIWVQEVPADPSNVTRAKMGFSGRQELEIAHTLTARTYAALGDQEAALVFSRQRLPLLRAEDASRTKVELATALYQAGITALRAGESDAVAPMWMEALQLLREGGQWRRLLPLLEALSDPHAGTLHLTDEQRTALHSAAQEGHEQTKSKEPALAGRYARWLALHNLKEALDTSGRSPGGEANPLAASLEQLDAAVAQLEEAHRWARRSDREELEAHLARMLGRSPEGLMSEGLMTDESRAQTASPSDDDASSSEAHADNGAAHDDNGAAPAVETAPEADAPSLDWRVPLSQAIVTQNADERRAWLQRAVGAFHEQPAPPRGQALPAFLDWAAREAMDKGDTHGAWHILERARLLELQPPAARAGAAAPDWPALRDARGTPDYAARLQKAGPLTRALEGRPLKREEIIGALQGDACLLQRFAPLPQRTFWFLHTAAGLEGAVVEGDALQVPEAWREKVASASTVYVDPGPRRPEELSFSTTPAHVMEVPSASYLVAAFSLRNLARAGRALFVPWATSHQIDPGPEANTVPPPVSTAPAEGELPSGLQVVALEGPVMAVNPGEPRAGARQVAVGPLLRERPRFTLNTLAQLPLNAQVLMLTPPADRGSRRALQVAALMAGAPSLVYCPQSCSSLVAAVSEALPEHRLAEVLAERGLVGAGYRGMNRQERITFAAQRYAQLEKQAVAAYSLGIKTGDAAAWAEAETALEAMLDVIAFLRAPQHFEELQSRDAPLAARLAERQLLAWTLLSRTLRHRAKFVEAGAVQRQMLEAFEQGGRAAQTVEALAELGKIYASASDPAQAAELFQRCAEAADKLGNVLAASDCRSRLGSMQRELFQFSAAEKSYQAAAAGYASQSSHNQAHSLRFLGFLYEGALSDYPAALRTFEQALALAQEHAGNTSHKDNVRAEMRDLGAKLRVDMARVHRSLGDYDRGLEELAQAKRESRHLGPVERAEVVLEEARIYWYRGNYRRAFARQRETLELAVEANRTHATRKQASFIEIQARSLAGLIHLNQGNLQVGETAFLDALRLARNTDRRSEEARQLNNLGALHLEAGRVEEAIADYEQALAIETELGSKEGQAYALRGLGIARHRQGSLPQAREIVQRALELSRSIGNSYNELRCLYALARIEDDLKQGDPAAHYRAAIDIARRTSVPELEWRSLYALGRMALANQETEEARERLEEALSVAERLGRSHSESAGERNRTDLYGDLIAMALREGNLNEVYHLTERSRARNLLDVLATATLELPNREARALLRRELRAREAMHGAERALQLGENGAQQRVAETAAAYQQALDALWQAHPRLARVLTIRPASLDQLREHLPHKTLVLSYFVGTRSTVVLLIDSTQVDAMELPIGKADLHQRVSNLRRQMDAFYPVAQPLAALSELVLGPLGPQLSGFETVVVLPDGPLYHVPFAALPLGDAALLDAAVVVQAPSGSVLTDRLEQPASGRPKVVAALAPASDLPYARLEAQEVATRAWLGPEATEEVLRNLTADALDVAAHGRLDPHDPMSSGLQLAPGPSDGDGRLEIREVFGLSKLPPLLTLSACSSIGEDTEGTEWMSLAHAFLSAGAHSLVASQGRVSDLTSAVLMKRFYRWVRELPPGQALRKAALFTRTYWPHPAHWARFTLVGDFR